MSTKGAKVGEVHRVQKVADIHAKKKGNPAGAIIAVVVVVLILIAIL